MRVNCKAWRRSIGVLLPLLLWATLPLPAFQKSIKELGKGGAAALPQLAPYLSDPDEGVREDALRAVVEIGGTGSLPLLQNSLQDGSTKLQMLATDGLVNYYLPGYFATGLGSSFKKVGNKVMSRWTDTNDQVVPPHVIASPETLKALSALATGNAANDAKANALRALGILRANSQIDPILKAMDSKDSRVLYEGLVALEKIRDRSVATRVHYLLRDLDEKVQLAALETVGLLMNPESGPPLREAFARAKNDRVRRAALQALARIPDEANRGLLEANLESSDDGLRSMAAEGLGRLKKQEDAAKIRQRFEEEKKMRSRLGLAFALVKLGDLQVTEFSALRYLIDTLNQKSWGGIARGLLGELLQEEAVRKAIYPVLPSTTKLERQQLAQLLGYYGGADAVPHLETLGRDPDPEVGSEALRALQILRSRL